MKISLQQVVCALVASLALAIGTESASAQTPLLVYDFNLGPDVVANVEHVKSLGFQGIVTRLREPLDVEKFNAYARHIGPADDFQLMAYVFYDFDSPAAPFVWQRALPVLERIDAPLWVIVRNAPSEGEVIALLRTMATAAAARGVTTVIYPHALTNIETADEAAVLIDKIAHPELRNSLHTCHELVGGNQDTIADVVAEHVDETAIVTIAGAKEDAADTVIGPDGVDWSQVIKPLDEGEYSLLPFLQALADADYDGPVVLHTFGIVDNPGHLEDSIAKYDEYLEAVAQGDV